MTACRCGKMLIIDDGPCAWCGTGQADPPPRRARPRYPAVPNLTPVYDCREWTQRMVIAAVRRWHRETGHPPRCTEWERAGAWWPSHYLVTRLFPSWKAAIFAAGLTPPASGRPPMLARAT